MSTPAHSSAARSMTAAPLPRPVRLKRGARHSIRTGARLSLARWVLVAEASALVVATRLALTFLPFRTVRSAFEGLPSGRGVQDETRARDAAWAVEAAAQRLLGRRPCLPQALVGQWLLRRAGVETKLKIGVARDESGVRAHAWLEHAGQVVVGGRGSAVLYVPLAPIVTSQVATTLQSASMPDLSGEDPLTRTGR